MNTSSEPIREEQLKEIAHQFRYPPTPDVSEAVMARLESGNRPKVQLRSAWVVMGLLVLALAALFAVPSVRAEIIRFFQVGAVRIFPSAPTLTAEPSIPQLPTTATPMAISTSIAIPASGLNIPIYEVTMSGLAGEISLAEAQAVVPFPIRLPQYPTDLGTPDRVFLQEDGGMVILVWTDPDNPDNARLSLHEIAPGKIVLSKFQPLVTEETQVNENYAVWTQGPHILQLTNGAYDFRRMVEGNTLIWEDDETTYRLESDMTLEETLRIAESLR